MSTSPDRPSASPSRSSAAAGAPPRPDPATRPGRRAGALGLLAAVAALHAVVLREAMAIGLPVPAARPAAAAAGERTQRALRVRTVAPADAAFAETADAAPAWPGAAAAEAVLPALHDAPAPAPQRGAARAQADAGATPDGAAGNGPRRAPALPVPRGGRAAARAVTGAQGAAVPAALAAGAVRAAAAGQGGEAAALPADVAVPASAAPAAAVPRDLPASDPVARPDAAAALAKAPPADAAQPSSDDAAGPAGDAATVTAAPRAEADAEAADPAGAPEVRAAGSADAPPSLPDLLLAAAEPASDSRARDGVSDASRMPRPAADGRAPAASTAAEAAARGGARAAPAPEAGARNGAPAAPAPAQVPVYRTRIPPPALLSYDMRRGPLSGTGQLDWKPEGERYTARLESRVLGVRLMVLESRGAFDADGIAPVRYTDERRGRSAQAANFRRTPGGEGGKITYSGPSDEVPLPRGAQDRLSWMLQLSAIAAADPARVGPGGRVSMFVSGARADADVWTFTHLASEPLAIGDRKVNAVHLVREPRGEHDTRAEVWLDPERSYLPVRARLSNGQGQDAGDALELMLRS